MLYYFKMWIIATFLNSQKLKLNVWVHAHGTTVSKNNCVGHDWIGSLMAEKNRVTEICICGSSKKKYFFSAGNGYL